MQTTNQLYDIASLKRRCMEVIEAELGAPASRHVSHLVYLCPFHSEKTASFAVWEDHFFCFGCGAHGDTVDFITRRYQMTTIQALKYLGAGTADAAAIEEYKAFREEERRKRAEALENRRSAFASSGVWEKHHAALDAQSRALWQEAGIPAYYQDIWRLGYIQDKCYEYQQEMLHSPALTIPYFSFINGRAPQVYTVQYRLLQPANPKDKYRFEADLGSGPWIAQPHLHPGEKLGRALVTEGAKKGMNAHIILNGCMQVVAAPSKTGISALIDILKAFEEIYIWLDPDVTIRPTLASPAWRPPDEMLCAAVGRKARFIRYPKKLDDAILEHGLTGDDLLYIMRYTARKI